MKKQLLNNFIIFALLLMLIYQTGELWLEENMGRNFFYSIKSAFQGGTELNAEISAEIAPEAVIAGYGDKHFYVLRDEESYSGIYSKAGEAFRELLNEGKFLSSEPLDWDSLLSTRSIIFKFPFSVSSSEYSRWMDETGELVTDKAEKFDYFGISVSSSGSSRILIFFVNTEADQVYTFELEKNDTAADFYNATETLRTACQDKLVYISTKQNGLNIFGTNIFVPQFTDGEISYKKISAENPFLHNGEMSPGLLESAIYPFFNKLSAKRSSIDENTGTYVFSDEVNIAKYYKSGLLEFYSYETAEGSGEQSLATALYACEEFIRKDPSLDTGLFLAGAELRSEGLVFYYDYEVNEMPVVLSEKVLANTGLSHAVEVTVKNNMVKKYRRYAYNFVPTADADAVANVDFATAMDSAVASLTGENLIVQIEDLYLGYCTDMDGGLELCWFTVINGETYISPAYTEPAE